MYVWVGAVAAAKQQHRAGAAGCAQGGIRGREEGQRPRPGARVSESGLTPDLGVRSDPRFRKNFAIVAKNMQKRCKKCRKKYKKATQTVDPKWGSAVAEPLKIEAKSPPGRSADFEGPKIF